MTNRYAILIGYGDQINIIPLRPSEEFPKYMRLEGVGSAPMFRRTHIRPRKDGTARATMEVYRAKR